jgi:hypothetical protein
MQAFGRRCIHRSQVRRPADDQPDVDRVVIPAPDKLLCSVERVDKEVSAAVGRNSAGRDLLFRDDRDARSKARERREDDQLRRPVRCSDR